MGSHRQCCLYAVGRVGVKEMVAVTVAATVGATVAVAVTVTLTVTLTDTGIGLGSRVLG